jgi:hypothetical protein
MPRGIYPRRPKAHVHKVKPEPKSANGQRPALPREPIEVLTDEDPTLGNILKRITITYNEREDQADRANYLKYLYEALEDIDDSLKTDEEV